MYDDAERFAALPCGCTYAQADGDAETRGCEYKYNRDATARSSADGDSGASGGNSGENS